MSSVKRKVRWRIGADPEFFLKCGQVPISAHLIVPGTKYEPHKVKKGAVQVDGVAAEFNIDPATSAKAFKTNIKTVLRQLRDMVPEMYQFEFTPVMNIDLDYFNSLPESSKLLGCTADFNAYTELMNDAPSSVQDEVSVLRTAAGHIHVGWDRDMDENDPVLIRQAAKVARQLDHVLLPGSVWFGHVEANERRNQMYGASGAFRPKPYGMEYRAISNTWLQYEESVDWVFNATYAAVDALFNKDKFESMTMFRQCRLVKSPNRSTEYFLNTVFKDYGIPPLPSTLTPLTY